MENISYLNSNLISIHVEACKQKSNIISLHVKGIFIDIKYFEAKWNHDSDDTIFLIIIVKKKESSK